MSVTHKGAPTFEIKGDPAAIRGRIAVMRDRASDFERIAWSLQEISVSGWSGRAAERFHEHFKLQPEKWWCASATFGRAADAWEANASALEQAQTRASEAKVAYEEGIAAVEAALAEQKWAAEHPKIGIFGMPEVDLSYHPERDTRPGEAKQAQAVADFEAAVSDTDAAGETLSQILYEQANRSPDLSWAPVHFMKRVGAGIFDGVWGLLSMQYGLALEGMRDYGRYMLGWITWDELQAKQKQNKISPEDLFALRDAIMADPTGFAKKMWDALINAEGWEDDPGAALGELVPAAVLAALTAGGGNAARAAAVLESLPIIGEGMMLRDMGIGAATHLPRVIDDVVQTAERSGGHISSRLEEYLRKHGLDDIADKWKTRNPVVHDPQSGAGDTDLPSAPKDGHDVASLVPHKSYQDESVDPPQVGLAKRVRGADLVDDPTKVLGVHEDGSSYTYEEWFEEHKYWGYNNDAKQWEWMVKWPENDGYDEEGRVFYSSVKEYVKDHGRDLDRIGHPGGKYLGVVENGRPASFEERSLEPHSLHDHYYRYKFRWNAKLPDGSKIETGHAAAWGEQPGGARQLRIIKDDGKPASIQEMLDHKITRGKWDVFSWRP